MVDRIAERKHRHELKRSRRRKALRLRDEAKERQQKSLRKWIDASNAAEDAVMRGLW